MPHPDPTPDSRSLDPPRRGPHDQYCIQDTGSFDPLLCMSHSIDTISTRHGVGSLEGQHNSKRVCCQVKFSMASNGGHTHMSTRTTSYYTHTTDTWVLCADGWTEKLERQHKTNEQATGIPGRLPFMETRYKELNHNRKPSYSKFCSFSK